jgi:hypothetical protein
MIYDKFSDTSEGQIMRQMIILLAVVLTSVHTPVFADTIEVTVNRANVRTNPGTLYTIMLTIHKGDSLPVIGSEKNWWLVKLKDGREGWIYKKAVTLVKGRDPNEFKGIAEEVLGEYLKWSVLNEVYIEEYQTARLDVMVTPAWARLNQEKQKSMMIELAREFTELCDNDETLKKQDRERPFVAFFDRYNTLLGKANQFDAVFSNPE